MAPNTMESAIYIYIMVFNVRVYSQMPYAILSHVKYRNNKFFLSSEILVQQRHSWLIPLERVKTTSDMCKANKINQKKLKLVVNVYISATPARNPLHLTLTNTLHIFHRGIHKEYDPTIRNFHYAEWERTICLAVMLNFKTLVNLSVTSNNLPK